MKRNKYGFSERKLYKCFTPALQLSNGLFSVKKTISKRQNTKRFFCTLDTFR